MNRHGSSERGGTAWEVEPERCRLDETDFLGAMEVDLWSRSAKIARKNERGSIRGSKKKKNV